MTDSKEFLEELRRLAGAYLDGNLNANAYVEEVNVLMADHVPDGLSGDTLEALDAFHLDISLYVEDADIRSEQASYYGPEELRAKVLLFLETLSSMGEST